MKIVGIILSAILAMVLVGCSSEPKPPTCEVSVSNNQINVVIDLPEEETEYRNSHDLSPSGVSGTPSKVTIESGGSEVEYSKTGNTYNIEYTVNYEQGEITSYDISIKGNVYGDTEHTCKK
jgi:hypothetical protein